MSCLTLALSFHADTDIGYGVHAQTTTTKIESRSQSRQKAKGGTASQTPPQYTSLSDSSRHGIDCRLCHDKTLFQLMQIAQGSRDKR